MAFSYSFPKEYMSDYKAIITEAKNRIVGKPVKLEFSVKEFKYKLEQIKKETDAILILRPVDSNLISFYEKLGFKEFTATNIPNDLCLTPCGEFAQLAEEYKQSSGSFTAMYLSDKDENLENLYFPYSMP